MPHRPALLALLCLATLPAIEVPPPAAMPDATSYVVAIVPDLRGVIAHVEAAAGALGVPLPPGMLASQLGAAFNDPQLANLGSGPLVAVLAPGVPIPTWACIVPAAQPEALAAAAGRLGMSAEAVPGAVVLAQTVDGVALGKALAPQAAALAPAKPAPDLRLLVAGDRLMATYLPFLLGVMQNAPHPPGRPAPDPKVMAGIGALLRVIASEAGSGQIDVALSADGLRLDWTAAPKAGGILAKALVAPLPAGPRPLAGRFGQVGGHLVLSARINPAVTRGFGDILAQVAADPQGKQVVTPEMVGLLRDCAAVCTGEMIIAQGVGGKVGAQEGLYGITDPAKCAALADAMIRIFSAGPLADFYASMGMAVVEEPNVRKGPAGERIDRVSLRIDPAKAPPGMGDAWQHAFKPGEAGFGRDAVAMSPDPKAVDLLLGAGRGPCVLAAERTLGPGWDGYLDYDLGLQFRGQAELMAGTPLAAIFAGMPTGHPVAAAWAIRDGRLRLQVVVPMALAKDLKDHFQKLQQQRPNRRHGGDGAPPVEGPAPPSATPLF